MIKYLKNITESDFALIEEMDCVFKNTMNDKIVINVDCESFNIIEKELTEMARKELKECIDNNIQYIEIF